MAPQLQQRALIELHALKLAALQHKVKRLFFSIKIAFAK
jgi:hypothetical protein